MSQYNYLDIYRSVAAFTQAVHALGLRPRDQQTPASAAFALNDLALQAESEKEDKLRQLSGSMNTPTVRRFVGEIYDHVAQAINQTTLHIATRPGITEGEVRALLHNLQLGLMHQQEELSRLHDEEHRRAYIAECDESAKRSQEILRQFMLKASEQNEASLAAQRDFAARQPHPA